MANLKQLKFTLNNLGIESGKVDIAISALEEVSESLEKITVQGREAIDQMLGCMMGIEQIIGNEEQSNSRRFNR